MLIPKSKPIRSKKYKASFKGKKCRHCGNLSRTVVPAHYSGLWESRVCNAGGMKPHDIATTELCMKCHDRFDQHKNAPKMKRDASEEDWLAYRLEFTETSLLFALMCLETIADRINEGVIKLP